MSLLDLLEVPLAQSRASTRAVVSPRVTASSALPAPTTPPPPTSPPSSRSAIRAIAPARAAGDSAVTTSPPLPAESADIYPAERALYRLFPAGVARCPLLLIPFRRPAFRLVPVGLQLIGRRPEPGGQAGRV